MLGLAQFSVGTLSDAQPLSLILPRDQWEGPILVGAGAEERRAVFIDPGRGWRSFEYAENHHHAGVIVANVEIEVDGEQAVPADRYDLPLGALVRAGASLFVVVAEGDGFRGAVRRQIVTGLPRMADHQAAAFTRWQITLGAGVDKQVLKTIEVGGTTSSRA